MADREKLIRAMEYCTADITPVDENDECLGDVCPFKHDGYESGDCQENMIRAALALLKEQEARVLEFLEISETTTYWMEDNHEANRKITCIPETIMDIMGDRVFTIPVVKLLNGYAPVISKNREGYGKKWRAWTSRPDEEQMKNTPWEPPKGDRNVQDEN